MLYKYLSQILSAKIDRRTFRLKEMNALNIALFEDDQSLCEDLVRLLRAQGHAVVLVCMNMNRARDSLRVDQKGHLLGGMKFDVAIVDGNLSYGRFTGEDGAEICELLSGIEESQRPHIIGNSGGGDVSGADTQAYKNLGLLLALLRSL